MGKEYRRHKPDMVDILPIRALPGIVLHFFLNRDEGATAPSSRTHAPVEPVRTKRSPIEQRRFDSKTRLLPGERFDVLWWALPKWIRMSQGDIQE